MSAEFIRKALTPIKKLLVKDLLEEAGMDVSDWANFKGGPSKAAANPKYCYNWSFEQPGEFVAVCLWHPDLKPHGKTLSHTLIPKSRGSKRSGPGSAVWNRRADEMKSNVLLAYTQSLPLRIIVVKGDQRNPNDLKPKASVVKARLLDPVPWAVKSVDLNTGEWLLVRGEKPLQTSVSAADVELSWFEGAMKKAFIYHRRRESAARREKIRDSLAKNSGRLICEVPNCRFDFRERFGELGRGFTHVHHLAPLSNSPKEGRLIKLTDLAIVCANCHAMIHRGGECRPLKDLIP